MWLPASMPETQGPIVQSHSSAMRSAIARLLIRNKRALMAARRGSILASPPKAGRKEAPSPASDIPVAALVAFDPGGRDLRMSWSSWYISVDSFGALIAFAASERSDGLAPQ